MNAPRHAAAPQKTDDEYVLADRSASVAPVAFSLMASFMSAITLLGVTRENYSYGTQGGGTKFNWKQAEKVHIDLRDCSNCLIEVWSM